MNATWITHAADKLDDPIMLNWALGYHDLLGADTEAATRAANQLFTPAVIRRLLESDIRMLRRKAMRELPMACFAPCAELLAAGWRDWTPDFAARCALILATVAPESAAACFHATLDAPQPWPDAKVAAILDASWTLPPALALAVLEKIEAGPGKIQANRELELGDATFWATAECQPEALPMLFDKTLMDGCDEFETATALAKYLFGTDLHACLAIGDDDPDECKSPAFCELAGFFEADAPLAEIDQAVFADDKLAAALALLEQYKDKSPKARLTWDMLQGSKLARDEANANLTATLALAAVAAAFTRGTLDTDALTPAGLVSLYCDGDTPPNYLPTLSADLRRRDHAEQVAAVLAEMDDEMDDESSIYQTVRLHQLMGELGCVEFVQPLIGEMGKKRGDSVRQSAKLALAVIGGAARDALIAQWDKLDDTQRQYGIKVVATAGGPEAGGFALQRFDALYANDPESWCELVTAAPDPRLLERLTAWAGRKQNIIDVAIIVSCRLLDAESPALADCTQRALPEQRRQIALMERLAHGTLDLKDVPLQLPLTCGACGASNVVEVKGVAISDLSLRRTPLLADEFPCPSCGAWAEFTLDPDALTAIAFELDYAVVNGQKRLGYAGPLLFPEMEEWSDGSRLPLSEALERLRKMVAAMPDDWKSWHRLGVVLHRLKRPRAAQECLAKARALNPFYLEGIAAAAQELESAGDNAAAFETMRRALADLPRLHSVQSDAAKGQRAFAMRHNRLRTALGRTDVPVLEESFFPPPLKAGRNDPCPCGSGKKFKKCCGK